MARRRDHTRWLGAWLALVLLSVAACGLTARTPGPPAKRPGTAATTPQARPAPQLPRGGRTLFPAYRVVAYYGTAGTDSLGVLGSEPPDEIAGRIATASSGFASPGRRLQPAMELIVTVADSTPGPDGNYNHSLDRATVWRYLRAARAHHQLLILDIQPGHQDFPDAVRPWAGLLAQPDVGLALDAQWRMPAGAVPGDRIGHADAREVNRVSAWLAGIVRAHRLPQKLLLIHQFTAGMIRHPAAIAGHPELAMVQQLDGFGSPAVKLGKYARLQRPGRFHMGFKLFYTQDHPLLSPARVLALHPSPDYVSYQ